MRILLKPETKKQILRKYYHAEDSIRSNAEVSLLLVMLGAMIILEAVCWVMTFGFQV